MNNQINNTNVIENLTARASLNTEFETRLAEAKAKAGLSIQSKRLRSDVAINDALRRESIKSMKNVIKSVYELLGLDTESLERKFSMIRRSEYGRVPELVNILAGTYNWPITQGGDAKSITELQYQIIEHLAEELDIIIEGELLLDVKEAKGFHSFLDNEEFVEISGTEPDFEEYTYFVDTIAEACGLPFIDHKLSETKWLQAETKSAKKVQAELVLAQQALVEAEALLSA